MGEEEEALMSREESLVEEVGFLYRKIREQETLQPSEAVNALFSQLVSVCVQAGGGWIDMKGLGQEGQKMREHLIQLCGQAEGLLEAHWSKELGSMAAPLQQLALFPYYGNYRKLALLEYELLSRAWEPEPLRPARMAFLGSGPLPLTSLVLAMHHLPTTQFDNFDVDPIANLLAGRLLLSSPAHPALSLDRMAFHTCDVNHLTHQLAAYQVVFLAALVGLDTTSKRRIIAHLAKHMSPGAFLVVRSAHGARAFLYPIVDPLILQSSGFDVLSVFHPSDEVVNSIIIARLKERSSSEDDVDDEDHDSYEDDVVD